MIIIRYTAYICIVASPFIYQTAPFSKSIFFLLVCGIADFFYRHRNMLLYRTIWLYLVLNLINSTVFYSVLWSDLIPTSLLNYQDKLSIHYFKNEHLPSYILYFMYAAVHLNALSKIRTDDYAPLFVVFFLSIILFLPTFTFDRIDVENLPNGWADDSSYLIWLHSVVASYVIVKYMMRIYALEKVDPRQFALMVIYMLYIILIIIENITTPVDFNKYFYSYSVLLVIINVILYVPRHRVHQFFVDNRIKYLVIGLCVGLVFLEKFIAFKIHALIIILSFFVFMRISDDYVKKQDKKFKQFRNNLNQSATEDDDKYI